MPDDATIDRCIDSLAGESTDFLCDLIRIPSTRGNEQVAASRGYHSLFDRYENPMPVTFGMMRAGDWPATAPASVKGVFGFLPNTTVNAVQQGMIEVIRDSPHEYLRKNFELHRIPVSLSFEAAALVEPLANVVTDVVLTQAVMVGDSVAVTVLAGLNPGRERAFFVG